MMNSNKRLVRRLKRDSYEKVITLNNLFSKVTLEIVKTYENEHIIISQKFIHACNENKNSICPRWKILLIIILNLTSPTLITYILFIRISVVIILVLS